METSICTIKTIFKTCAQDNHSMSPIRVQQIETILYHVKWMFANIYVFTNVLGPSPPALGDRGPSPVYPMSNGAHWYEHELHRDTSTELYVSQLSLIHTFCSINLDGKHVFLSYFFHLYWPYFINNLHFTIELHPAGLLHPRK
jgi:hypothetical protein